MNDWKGILNGMYSGDLESKKIKLIKKSMKKFLITCFVAVNILALGACSDKDDPEPGTPGGKKAKFTITVEGANANDDYISFVFSSRELNGGSSIWKVNGESRPNEGAISFNDNDFINTKTYVIESTELLPFIAVGIQCINYGDQLKISYKAEIDGKVAKEESKTLTGDGSDYTVDYSY